MNPQNYEVIPFPGETIFQVAFDTTKQICGETHMIESSPTIESVDTSVSAHDLA